MLLLQLSNQLFLLSVQIKKKISIVSYVDQVTYKASAVKDF